MEPDYKDANMWVEEILAEQVLERSESDRKGKENTVSERSQVQGDVEQEERKNAERLSQQNQVKWRTKQ